MRICATKTVDRRHYFRKQKNRRTEEQKNRRTGEQENRRTGEQENKRTETQEKWPFVECNFKEWHV